jgi:hypothetical protein
MGTQQSILNSNILDSITIKGDIFFIQKSGNMFLVRRNKTTIKMHMTELSAREHFQVYRNSNLKGGEKLMTAQEKAREVADGLKAEKVAKEEQEAKAVSEVRSQLAIVEDNSNLAAMYNESANVGAENIGGQSLPILRIHAAGKSTNNELEDGTEPLDGSFYYKPTKEDLGSEIDVHILTISRGFKTEPMEGSDKEYTFNQIVGGIIGNDKPFVMYFNGTKLQNLWNFGKEAGQYTRRKPVAFPMFSLKVKLTTKKGEKGKYAAPWIVNFKILRDEEQKPLLILDEGEFQYIKDSVAVMEETIANVIAAKELRPTVGAVAAQPIVGEVAEDDLPPAPDDIPFS